MLTSELQILRNANSALLSTSVSAVVFAAGEQEKSFTVTANGAVPLLINVQIDAELGGVLRTKTYNVVRVSRIGCE